MRLLAAGLLVAALLVLPTAAAATSTTLGLSGASAVVDLTQSATQYIPITVNLRITSGFFCQNEGTAIVKLALNSTGPITASLNATSVKFTIPADATVGGSGLPNGGHALVDYDSQQSVNLTVSRAGAGNGTAGIVATFDGNVDGCSVNPDPLDPTAEAKFQPATKSLNVTTQSLVGNATNTTTTPTNATPTTNVTTSTPVSSTPTSTSPTGPTVGENPTPTPEETEGKKFLGIPGPAVPLVIAGAVAVAVLLRRKP